MSEIQITGKQLIDKAREVIQQLIDTGAKSWSLNIPARVNEDPDLILSRVITDYESERQAHEATKKELEEAVMQKLSAINQFDEERQFCIELKKELEDLQDAIADYSETYDCKFHGEEHVLIVKAIQESHNRRKNNE